MSNQNPRFRAWDKRINKFIYKNFFDRNWYLHPTENQCYKSMVPEDRSYITLMFSTDHFDSNKVEIFERDIIHYSEGFWGEDSKFPAGEGTVYLDTEGWQVKITKDISMSLIELIQAGPVEVVGYDFEIEEEGKQRRIVCTFGESLKLF